MKSPDFESDNDDDDDDDDDDDGDDDRGTDRCDVACPSLPAPEASSLLLVVDVTRKTGVKVGESWPFDTFWSFRSEFESWLEEVIATIKSISTASWGVLALKGETNDGDDDDDDDGSDGDDGDDFVSRLCAERLGLLPAAHVWFHSVMTSHEWLPALSDDDGDDDDDDDDGDGMSGPCSDWFVYPADDLRQTTVRTHQNIISLW